MADNQNNAVLTSILMWEKTSDAQFDKVAGVFKCKLTVPVNCVYILLVMILMIVFIVYTPSAVNYIKLGIGKLWQALKKVAEICLATIYGQD